jgi:hypothetical protein
MTRHVMIRLKEGTDVIGILLFEGESMIDIGDACIVRYMIGLDGIPSIALLKYCSLTSGFNVNFKRDDVLHVFYDPLDTITRIKSNYVGDVAKANDISSFFENLEPSKEDDDELIDTLDAMHSSNTTIQ